MLGACHCGGIKVELTTSLAPHELRVRCCSCSFCRKHGARTTTDPNGRLRIEIRSEVLRYQFATKSAEYLICARCGVYVAAVMDGAYARSEERRVGKEGRRPGARE